MTRAALGMHIIAKTPSAKCLKAVEAGDTSQFTDFSQMLYWFASASCSGDVPGNEDLLPPFSVSRSASDDGSERFDAGEIVDFEAHRKKDKEGPETFDLSAYDELPSIPLNPYPDEEGQDVRERGRLKFTADALDFFSEDGEAGVMASNRIKGVVLHDILSRVIVPSDLEASVNLSLQSGEITSAEASGAMTLLAERLDAAASRGWFRDDADRVLNEASLIDTDGEVCRPDRVEIHGDKVIIIDYKFGEHYRLYERQLRKYASIWRRMGYSDVSAYLWYVHTDEVMEVS